MSLILAQVDPATDTTPASGKTTIGVNSSNQLYTKDSAGTVNVVGGGGGSGTVTSVAMTSTDLAVSGSPITTSGTIIANLNTTSVIPGSYNYATLTVDSKGRLTAASSNTPVSSFNTRTGDIVLASADVTTALGFSPVQSFNTRTGAVTLTSTDVTGALTYTPAHSGANADITSMSGITGGISTADYIDFHTTASVTPAAGRIWYDDAEGGLNVGMKGGNTILQVGQEMVQRVTNQTGAGLTDGQVVYVNGAIGNRMTVALAIGNSSTSSSKSLGVVTEPIANNGQGFITIEGLVHDLDTSAFIDGDILYLSPTTAGAITKVKPVAPQHMVTVGYCVKSHATTGIIYVKVDNGYELDELHNVLITTPSTGQALTYNSTTSVWENTTLPSGLPAQSGMSGKLLTTNGTAASWDNKLAQLSVGTNAVVLPSPVSYPLQSVSTTSSGLTLARFSADTSAGTIAFVKSRSTTAGTYGTAVVNGDVLGSISTFADDGSATLPSAQSSGIQFTSTENWNSTSHGSDLRFYTTPNASITKTERLRLTHDGRLALGTTSPGATSMSLNNPLTGSTTAMGVRVNSTILQDVTGVAYGFRSTLATAAAAFTLGSMTHYVVEGSAGAGSTITTQVGYSVPSGMTAATTNIAFNGNISYNAAKANWNFYAATDGWNYFNGNTGVGNVPALGQLFKVGGTGRITGATSAYAVLNNATVNSDVTTSAASFSSNVTTTANAFTLPSLIHFNASPNTLGAGSTITNQYGFYAQANLTAATNNYGFFSNIGSGTGRWNFYTAGTAQNYFNGITTIGSDVSTIAGSTAQKFQVHSGSGAGASLFRWSADASAPELRLIKSRSATMGTYGTALSLGDVLGNVAFFGDDGVSTGSTSTSAIGSVAAEAFTTTAHGSHIYFATTPTGSLTQAERARITAAGNVLIGTTTDDATNKLQVNGGISFTGSLKTGTAPSEGTTGQILMSNGWSAPPSWESVKRPAKTSVTSGTSISIDFGSSDIVRLTLTGNTTITSIINGKDGQECLLEIIQDATGGRTITWPSTVRWGTDVTTSTLSAGANKKDRYWLICDSSAGKYDVVRVARGF